MLVGTHASVSSPMNSSASFSCNTAWWPRALRFATVISCSSLGSTVLGQQGFTSISSRVNVPATGVSSTFTVAGNAPKLVLIRAIGPALGVFGIPGTLADPQIVLTNANGGTIASNDNWGGDSAVSAASARVGAFSFSASSRDAALVATVGAGTYTATVTGVGATSGVALLEIYDADNTPATNSVFSTLAIRAPSNGSGGPLVMGFVVAGNNLPILARALGPALAASGVAGTLTDPTLSITTAGGGILGINDNWDNHASLAAAGAQHGAIPLANGSRDSALLVTLGSGPSLAMVGSANGASGVVQIELFAMAAVSLAPAFTTQPASASLTAGSPLTLTAAAAGIPTPTYQWRKNGVAISGATAATFTIAAVQAADAGAYTCVATNSAGTATSAAAVVTVTALTTPAIIAQPSPQTVTAGGSITLSVGATGTPAPTFQWLKDNVPIPGATNATLTINAAGAANAGTYTVAVTNSQGTVTSSGAIVTVLPSAVLANLSVRTTMVDGQTLTVGMYVAGGSRGILMRAAGPALTPLGVTPVVTNPRIALFNAQGVQFSANDDWDASLAPSFASVAAFPFPVGSRDAALAQNLDGQVSVQVAASGSGALLVEAYDLGLSAGNTPRLVNMSVLSRVGTGGDVLIAGFNLSGTGLKRLLIRAVGPSLVPLGVTGVVADPRVEILNASGVRVGFNDNWDVALAPTIVSVGAFPLLAGSRDAALVVTLPVGTYSALMSGTDGSTGTGIIEMYELP
jgi:hypothetical protein